MSELVESNKCSFWPWSKGAQMWGQPLPYAHREGDQDFVMCGDWWNRDRAVRLIAWQSDAMHALLQLCGDDRYQRIRAVARTHRARMVALGEAAGAKLNERELFTTWVPTPEESSRIDDLVSGYTAARDRVRSWLLEARSTVPELEEELPALPEEWTPVHMAAALMRLPKILLTLIATGEVPDPGDLLPEGVAR